MIIFFILTLSVQSFASGESNITFAIAYANPKMSLQNPDESLAYYKGESIALSTAAPLGHMSKSLSFRGSLSYLMSQLENTTTLAVNETVHISGPVLGLAMSFYSIQLGLNYGILSAKHQSVAAVSNSLNYDFNTLGYHVGIIKSFGSYNLGIVYRQNNADVSSQQTGLSGNTIMANEGLWFTLSFDLGVKSSSVFSSLAN